MRSAAFSVIMIVGAWVFRSSYHCGHHGGVHYLQALQTEHLELAVHHREPIAHVDVGWYWVWAVLRLCASRSASLSEARTWNCPMMVLRMAG
jgi:hypothetical protein